jgi:hypothetical protein
VTPGDPEPGSLDLFRGALGFVGDWSNFAFTGPVSGARYRFELEPTLGSLTYTSALLDYRRYFFWSPVTLAVRGLHYGRYGRDAEDERFLAPLFLGAGTLVRGYGMDSFRAEECSGLNGGDGCPEFERLIGSRIAVTGLELRLPLLGTQAFGVFSFPLLPTTVGAFLDAGVAWTADETPELSLARESSERIPVASAGLFARTNLLGYLVVETWLANPFQRPAEGWTLGFTLSPGW